MLTNSGYGKYENLYLHCMSNKFKNYNIYRDFCIAHVQKFDAHAAYLNDQLLIINKFRFWILISVIYIILYLVKKFDKIMSMN